MLINTVTPKEFGWTPGANTIAYYPLKGDVKDYSGNGRDGTNNGVTFSGGVGVFDGASNISLGADERTNFQKLTNGTINIWFKRTGNAPRGQNSYIIGKARMHPNTQGNILYGIGYMDNYSIVAGVFPGNSRSPVPVPYGSNIDINLDTRYNFVLTKIGTTKNLYIDGNLIATQTAQDTTSTDNPPLTIGSATYSNSNSYVIGNISEVIFENKSRTAQEVLDYYNQTKSNYGL